VRTSRAGASPPRGAAGRGLRPSRSRTRALQPQVLAQRRALARVGREIVVGRVVAPPGVVAPVPVEAVEAVRDGICGRAAQGRVDERSLDDGGDAPRPLCIATGTIGQRASLVVGTEGVVAVVEIDVERRKVSAPGRGQFEAELAAQRRLVAPIRVVAPEPGIALEAVALETLADEPPGRPALAARAKPVTEARRSRVRSPPA
jgi:hypothetical protein